MERSRSERQAWGRIGGYVLRSRRDPREYTAAARAAFLGAFETAVDPNNELPTVERQARALAARRAHFARLAAKSAEARRNRKAAPLVADQGAAAEATDATRQPQPAA